jgi:hypothetical protein
MKQIENTANLPKNCIENLVSLLDFLINNKDKINLYMNDFKFSDNVYHGCDSSCCLIGHSYHQEIGLKGDEKYIFPTTGRVNYGRYSDDIFMTNTFTFKNVNLWSYLFAAWRSDEVKESIRRIENVLYSDELTLMRHLHIEPR